MRKIKRNLSFVFSKVFTRHTSTMNTAVEKMKFDNLAIRSLPIDLEKNNFTRQVSGACFSLVQPTPVENPTLVAFSGQALSLIDLTESDVHEQEVIECFAGNRTFKGSQTAAHCYCGHQFGNFAGQLGDGAAIYLGEVINGKDERWELQLKGAGKTPYSRTADGRKVLRSTIREFLCSEAMYGLGIPTTRAATCVTSDSRVMRDVFYDGNAIMERCTIVSRIAPSFIRFGSFEICKELDAMTGRQGPSVGRTDVIKQLLDYVVENFYPEVWTQHQADRQAMYVEFYTEVLQRTARLVAQWMSVGWCHGVLNTDNMSIVGVTIDYGPFGFLDAYDPHFICNGSDDGGRYAYDQQPSICKWNLGKLAEALAEIADGERMKEVLEAEYDDAYQRYYLDIMTRKFGLLKPETAGDPQFKDLHDSFLETMQMTGADFTNTFRALSRLPFPGSNSQLYSVKSTELIDYILTQCASVEDLKKANQPRMDGRQLNMLMMMMQVQPDMISLIRGGQSALLQELERRNKLKELETLTSDAKRATDRQLWSDWLSKYTAALTREQQGHDDVAQLSSERERVMKQTNPRYILRNYMAENAIRAAEAGDYSEVRRLLQLLHRPYDDNNDVRSAEDAKTVTSTDVDTGVTTGGTDNNERLLASSAPSTSTSSSTPSDAGTSVAGAAATHVAQICSYDAKPPQWAAELRVT